MAADAGDWRVQVRGWTANHFTISDHEANTPRLLRKIADAIEELGEIEILGVTWARELEGPTEQTKMSVFFKFPE
jgi:hypothetical protein